MQVKTPTYLAIDVGTHGVRAGLVNQSGQLLALHQAPVSLNRLDAVQVEQDAEEILHATQAVIAQCLAECQVAIQAPIPVAIEAAGLACQRSTVVAWCRDTGRALGPALSWQDTRGHAQVQALRSAEPDIRARSGLVLSPHYGASKLHWLHRQHRDHSTLALTPLVSFLLFHLLRDRPVYCDENNAGRSQLWNLRERRWDASLLGYFDVPQALLPQVLPTCANYGPLAAANIPLTAVAGDQSAALLGGLHADDQHCLLINLGSGAFALTLADLQTAPPPGLLSGLAWSHADTCQGLWEGTVNGAGLALSALGQRWQHLGGEAWLLAQLPQWLQTPGDHLFYNSVGGLGSPYWRAGEPSQFDPPTDDPQAQAVALVESIAFLLAENIRILCRAKPQLRLLRLTGGLARLDGLCQMLADLSGLHAERLQQNEATLMGVAQLAADFRITPEIGVQNLFVPQANPALLQRFVRFHHWIDSAKKPLSASNQK